jgi:hypothetical protein
MSDSAKTQSDNLTKRSSGIASRRLKAGSNTVVSIVGALVILGAVNYLAMRHYIRADWTASGLYTLSDKSLKVAEGLTKQVSMHMLWSAGDPSGRFEEAKEILDRYAAASPKISLEVIDPDMSPERVKMIIDQFGARIQQDMMGQVGIEAGIFVVSGENVKFVSAVDFESFDTGMFGGESEAEDLSGYKAEQSITSAIIQVTSEAQPIICFTQGHGEWIFEDRGPRGLGHLKEQLIQDGYKVEAITTAGASKIKRGCEGVIVVGPENAFLSEEAAIFEKYLTQGGKLMLFLDPVIDGTTFKPVGLEGLTAKFGIKLHKDLVFEVDVRRLLSDTPFTFKASEFTSHEAVKQLAVPDSVGADIKAEIGAYPVAFSMARTMSDIADTRSVVDVLAKTSKEAWGEVDLSFFGLTETAPERDQYDTQGPANLAMAASLPTESAGEEGGKLIVVGDSDVLQEELFMNAGLMNRDFFAGLVGWMTKRGELISISPKNPEHVRLNLTQEELGAVTNLIWGEIVFFVLLGIVVWFRRRS